MGARKRPLEYDVWSAMIQRCTNVRNHAYPRYGGRGVMICRAWRASFQAFMRDMGARPNKTDTLERIDNAGHYEPDNCCWATRLTQANNVRDNVCLAYAGKNMTVAQWAREINIPVQTLYSRIRLGFPIARILMNRKLQTGTPKLTTDDVRAIRRLLASGEGQTATAHRYGVSPATVRGILSGRLWNRVR